MAAGVLSSIGIEITGRDRGVGGMLRRLDEHVRGVGRGAERAGATFDKFGHGAVRDLRDMGRAAGETGRRLGEFLVPLRSLAGLATIGGVGALVDHFATLGAGVRRTAQTIGVSSRDLQRWQGAGEYAGISADAMSGAMGSLNARVHDAAYGLAGSGGMIWAAQHYHMALRDGSGHVRNASAFMGDLADQISRMHDPDQQRRFASLFGVTELLPLLRQGRGAIKGFMDEAQRAGVVMGSGQLDKADALYASWTRLGQSARGAGLDIAAHLAPAMGKVANWLDKDSNRKWLGTEIEKFFNWLENINFGAIEKAVGRVEKMFEDLGLGGKGGAVVAGGLGVAAILRMVGGKGGGGILGSLVGGAGRLMLGTTIGRAISTVIADYFATRMNIKHFGLPSVVGAEVGAPVILPQGHVSEWGKLPSLWGGVKRWFGGGSGGSSGALPSTTRGMFNYLTSLGASPAEAAGILGNGFGESGLDPSKLITEADGLQSAGLLMEHGSRLAAMQKALGPGWAKDWQGQLRWAYEKELKLDSGEYAGNFFGRTTAGGASDSFMRHFERPADQSPAALAKRRGYSVAILRAMSQPVTAMPNSRVSQRSGAALNDMMRLSGLSGSNPAVRQFIAANGGTLDPAHAAWCAAFVNASLAHEGIRGTGSNMASSFRHWGTGVSGMPSPGDVLLAGPSMGYSGHVGFATGKTRIGANGALQFQMMSSNTIGPGGLQNRSGLRWRNAADLDVRRATDADLDRDSHHHVTIEAPQGWGLNLKSAKGRATIGLRTAYAMHSP